MVNIGTLHSEQIAAAKLAVARARTAGIPWGFRSGRSWGTPYRRAAASALTRLQPNVIRGNGSEILALTQQAQSGQGRGVDSTDRSETAVEAARTLALETGAVVAVTGTVDYITDGKRLTEIHNGHPIMARVTGLGCSATALIGAFLGVERDAFSATVAGLALLGGGGGNGSPASRGTRQLTSEAVIASTC